MLAQVAELILATSRVILLADRGVHGCDNAVSLAVGLAFSYPGQEFHPDLPGYQRQTQGQGADAQAWGAHFFSTVWITKQRLGAVHLALAYAQTTNGHEKWAIVSDEDEICQSIRPKTFYV